MADKFHPLSSQFQYFVWLVNAYEYKTNIKVDEDEYKTIIKVDDDDEYKSNLNVDDDV